MGCFRLRRDNTRRSRMMVAVRVCCGTGAPYVEERK